MTYTPKPTIGAAIKAITQMQNFFPSHDMQSWKYLCITIQHQ